MDRIAAIGHGAKSDMIPEQALAVAKAATPAASGLGDNDPTGIAAGTRVTVTPDDNARVPATGTLVAADAREVMIAIDSDLAGALHVHFPRAADANTSRDAA